MSNNTTDRPNPFKDPEAWHASIDNEVALERLTTPRLVEAHLATPGQCPSWCDVPTTAGREHARDTQNVCHVGRTSTFYPTLEDDKRLSVGVEHWEDRNAFDGMRNHGRSGIVLEMYDQWSNATVRTTLSRSEARFLADSLKQLAAQLSVERWGDVDVLHAPAHEALKRD